MKIMKLSDIKQDGSAVLESIDKIEEKKQKRLLELGFVEGTKIKVLKKSTGLLLIGVRGYSIVLDKEITDKINVWGNV